MCVLAISSAYDGAAMSIVRGGEIILGGRVAEQRGLAAAVPCVVAELLAKAHPRVRLVAVVVGPGSFTGVRIGLSVAHGVGLGLGVPVVGVTVAEALLAEALLFGAGRLSGRSLWTAVHARRGRIFIDMAGGLRGYQTDGLPHAPAKVAVLGGAADIVAAALAARGTDVMLTSYRVPQPVHVAAAALSRMAGSLPALPNSPLYVDAAEAKLPTAGLRPRGLDTDP